MSSRACLILVSAITVASTGCGSETDNSTTEPDFAECAAHEGVESNVSVDTPVAPSSSGVWTEATVDGSCTVESIGTPLPLVLQCVATDGVQFPFTVDGAAVLAGKELVAGHNVTLNYRAVGFEGISMHWFAVNREAGTLAIAGVVRGETVVPHDREDIFRPLSFSVSSAVCPTSQADPPDACDVVTTRAAIDATLADDSVRIVDGLSRTVGTGSDRFSIDVAAEVGTYNPAAANCGGDGVLNRFDLLITAAPE